MHHRHFCVSFTFFVYETQNGIQKRVTGGREQSGKGGVRKKAQEKEKKKKKRPQKRIPEQPRPAAPAAGGAAAKRQVHKSRLMVKPL